MARLSVWKYNRNIYTGGFELATEDAKEFLSSESILTEKEYVNAAKENGSKEVSQES